MGGDDRLLPEVLMGAGVPFLARHWFECASAAEPLPNVHMIHHPSGVSGLPLERRERVASSPPRSRDCFLVPNASVLEHEGPFLFQHPSPGPAPLALPVRRRAVSGDRRSRLLGALISNRAWEGCEDGRCKPSGRRTSSSGCSRRRRRLCVPGATFAC